MAASRRRRSRIGVLGGTFDPIHHMHLLMARQAAAAFDLDTVLFAPAGTPSHRRAAEVTLAAHRCAMVSEAIAGEARFMISTVDVERPTRTYTFDTLRDLGQTYGSGSDLFFIVGADNLADVPRWYRAPELMMLAHFIGSSRRGFPLVDPGFPPGRLSLLAIPNCGISSTMIRSRVAQGRSIARLTPHPVARYIREHGLYRATPQPPRQRAADEFAGARAEPAPLEG